MGKNNNKIAAGSSIGLGSILAVVISWTTNKSIIWAVIHGILNWFYVIYYMITQDGWNWF
ncbi:MAG: hypothetical protein H6627_09385 [Calditrichae bacterium]|nr:hypothetical protein [Calditrichota bacterium]MCB9058768.1 hypothetical protein [Calditrichia bacterium]